MTTGNFKDFAGQISDIGPMYPFVGWEFVLFILGVVFWLAWHIWQIRIENNEYQNDLSKIKNQDLLNR